MSSEECGDNEALCGSSALADSVSQTDEQLSMNCVRRIAVGVRAAASCAASDSFSERPASRKHGKGNRERGVISM